MCVRLLLTVRSHSFVISALPQFSTSDSGSIFRGRIPSTEKAITISVLGKRSLMLSIMPWRKFFSTALNLVVMKKLNTCKYGKIAYGPNGPNWGWYNGPFWKPMGKWPEIPSQPHPWGVWSDLGTETTIVYDAKEDSGIVGLTRKKAALILWVICRHLLSAYIKSMQTGVN